MDLSSAPAGRGISLSWLLGGWLGLLALLVALPVHSSAASERQLQAAPTDSKPNFVLPSLDGASYDLRQQAGRVVLVHFFATWCEPCRDELSSLSSLARIPGLEPPLILAINVAEVPGRVRRFLEGTGLDFPVLLDSDRAVTRAWGVYALPTTFVLDRSLAPRLMVEGDLDWTKEDVVAALAPRRRTRNTLNSNIFNREDEIMSMNRRQVLKAGGALAAATALPDMASAQATFAPAPGAWRNFQTVTRLEIAKPAGQVQAWIPLPAFSAEDWFKPAGSTWTTNATTAEIKRDAKYNAEMLHVVWGADDKAPVVEVTSKFATRDRAVDLSKPGNAAALSAAEHKLYTSATDLIPVDGIVKETSDKITAGATSDLDKARRIYEWVVDNTFRNAKTRGCGVGDVASMLKSGNLNGKCADLNALYVGLARAAGLPGARCLWAARGPVQVRLQEPRRRLRGRHQGAALPRRGLPVRASAGCRSIPPTCARWCSRSRRPTWPSTTPRWSPRARPCSAPGR